MPGTTTSMREVAKPTMKRGRSRKRKLPSSEDEASRSPPRRSKIKRVSRSYDQELDMSLKDGSNAPSKKFSAATSATSIALVSNLSENGQPDKGSLGSQTSPGSSLNNPALYDPDATISDTEESAPEEGNLVESVPSCNSNPNVPVKSSDPPPPKPDEPIRKPKLNWRGGDKNLPFNHATFLADDSRYLAPDPLSKLPRHNHSYINYAKGTLNDPHKYAIKELAPAAPHHPDLQKHINNGTATAGLYTWYKDLNPSWKLPLAGIPRGQPRSVVRETKPVKSMKSTLTGAFLLLPNPPHWKEFQLPLEIQEIANLLLIQEENFLSRPSVKLVLPDHLKALLVDDWENVTKNQALVPLPSPKSVNNILEEYTAFEMKNRIPGSHQADLLEEVTAGLREYFDSCLGKLLLYRFERYQYFEIREAWNSSTDDLGGKKPSDTYGAEHLCRLLAILPELIAQTNMDQQSVNRLREELTKFTAWLGKNTAVYFANEYETPNQEYIDKARGV